MNACSWLVALPKRVGVPTSDDVRPLEVLGRGDRFVLDVAAVFCPFVL